ncbi:MAG: methyl-accepting chemotaxis protein [Marinomonas sp.]
MKPIDIDQTAASALDLIPESCGDVTVGCTDVAGIVSAVLQSSQRLRQEHNALNETVKELEADQNKVALASDEARDLSARATAQLGEGTLLIESSLSEINGLLELVETLSRHVTGFASAMEQVRRSSQDIEDIAETTNILALNATIEAMRAGEAGQTFAVVAGEVKNLANDTRRATKEISKTVETLGTEAGAVIEQIEQGSRASDKAKSSVAQIKRTINGAGDLLSQVDRQNEQITRSTSTISNHVGRVQQAIDSFDSATLDNEAKLANAHERMEGLEDTANTMFDRIVHAGLSPNDSMNVKLAQSYAQIIKDLTEAGLARGELSADALFDRNYIEIQDSNPVRYQTQLWDWAHENWRPILDEARASNSNLTAAACTDVNGYLPTHISEHSKEPTGDLAYDTKYCRNGRIIFDARDKIAKASDAPFTMGVYRQEGDGKNYVLVRNIYIPLYFEGKRWGDFEMAYQLR